MQFGSGGNRPGSHANGSTQKPDTVVSEKVPDQFLALSLCGAPTTKPPSASTFPVPLVRPKSPSRLLTPDPEIAPSLATVMDHVPESSPGPSPVNVPLQVPSNWALLPLLPLSSPQPLQASRAVAAMRAIHRITVGLGASS